MRLGDAMNTYNPALNILVELGYEVFVMVYTEEDGLEQKGDWVAVKDGNEFFARDPLALLGLVVLWEKRGASWLRADEENIYMDAPRWAGESY